jgi:prophage DNA circulation protein
MVSFTGGRKRRMVIHSYLKLDGGAVEDMATEQRVLVVQMEFLGADAARDYQEFENAVIDNPRGTLIHPIAGKWQAFCEGPDYDVTYSRAVDEIKVKVKFTEDVTNATLPDVPDAATAAQDTTAKLSAFETATATFMAGIAKAESFKATVLNKVDEALALIDRHVGGSNVVAYRQGERDRLQGEHPQAIGQQLRNTGVRRVRRYQRGQRRADRADRHPPRRSHGRH